MAFSVMLDMTLDYFKSLFHNQFFLFWCISIAKYNVVPTDMMNVILILGT